jgi:hypothetical protein
MAVPSAAPGVTSADALEYLQRLVHKRVELCDYIVRVHDGEAFWMNTTRICPADWVAFLGEAELFTRCVLASTSCVGLRVSRAIGGTCRRSAKVYLDLALNFGRLLTLPTGASVVRALTQLLLEYDYSVAQDGGILELVCAAWLGRTRIDTSPHRVCFAAAACLAVARACVYRSCLRRGPRAATTQTRCRARATLTR